MFGTDDGSARAVFGPDTASDDSGAVATLLAGSRRPVTRARSLEVADDGVVDVAEPRLAGRFAQAARVGIDPIGHQVAVFASDLQVRTCGIDGEGAHDAAQAVAARAHEGLIGLHLEAHDLRIVTIDRVHI